MRAKANEVGLVVLVIVLPLLVKAFCADTGHDSLASFLLFNTADIAQIERKRRSKIIKSER